MTEEQKIIVDNLASELKKTLMPYIGESINNPNLDKFKECVCQILDRFKTKYDDTTHISEYVDVKVDDKQKDLIIVTPKTNAPRWVFDVFIEVNKIPKQNI